MSNRIDKMMAKTAGLRPAKDIPDCEITAPARPKTAVGMTAALQTAHLRISELEARDSAMISLERIRPNPWQPRRVFDDVEIRSLADSISEVGLIQPVVVRKSVTPGDSSESISQTVTPGDTFYELVAGERRVRAHRLLGKDQVKAVVVEVSDDSMAIMALAENLDREDLSDYEVSIAIRRVEKEFPNRSRMAEALGMPRAELYRYLSFGKLPDFLLQDLEVSPMLLSRKSAEALQSVLSEHGDLAVEGLRSLWPLIKSGHLEHPKLAESVANAVQRGKTVRTDRDIKKLFVGKEQAGSITRDASAITVKIKVVALSAPKENRLREFVQKLLIEPD